MPDLPLPSQTDVTIQNQTTGAVDYLNYEGSSLVGSSMFDYGLGPDWKIVASTLGPPDGTLELVAQSVSTGRVDFLQLDSTGHLVSSAMSSATVPRIVGLSYGIGGGVGDALGVFASQLPDGELDFLELDTSTATLTRSDLVPGTAGLPHAVGVATADFFAFPEFTGVGSSDTVVTQAADGSLDLIGFGGTFGSSLAYTTSDLLAGSAGTPAIGAVNQNNGLNENEFDKTTSTQGLQLIGQTISGQPDVMYYDTGKNDTANTGTLYSTNLLSNTFPDWSVVDGGLVNESLIFPLR